MSSRKTLRTAAIGGLSIGTALFGVVAPSAANAASPTAYNCTGGSWSGGPSVMPSGTFSRVDITGLCVVPAGETMTITGDLNVAPGGVLVAISDATVHVQGNARAGMGAILALGCTAELGCTPTADQQVWGNVVATNARAIYLNGTHINGNVVINGGGPGADCIDTGFPWIGHDLPIKDNVIDGNVHIDGWAGCWIGFIRNQVGGSVSISRVVANVATDASGMPLDPQGPDSTEVLANVIGGSLTCRNNLPAAQYGDAGTPPYATNQVAGTKRGECANL